MAAVPIQGAARHEEEDTELSELLGWTDDGSDEADFRGVGDTGIEPARHSDPDRA